MGPAINEKETAVVICPGRGTYTPAELGYLSRHHGDKTPFLRMLSDLRATAGQTPLTELDAAQSYSTATHASGANASLLIFACALGDFLDIDTERFDIAAVTGNSMGWYLALTAGGALSLENGATLVNTMGTLMEAEGGGGQIVTPLVDTDWRADPAQEALIDRLLTEAAGRSDLHLSVSILLGGLIVLAGDEAGLSFAQEQLPRTDRFPLRLAQHNAFHSALLSHIPAIAQDRLTADLFGRPAVPLIDGRGHLWTPHGTNLDALYQYTLTTQVTETYDFARAVEVAVKEFAPDRLILLGPGTTLGAPIAQTLIAHRWRGLTNKTAFQEAQARDPFLISMGMADQRDHAV